MTYIAPMARRIRDLAVVDAEVPGDAALLFEMYALLARSKGVNTELKDVHDAWVVWMTALGESHPSMVPFEDLDRDTQREDEPFLQAIRTAATEQEIL